MKYQLSLNSMCGKCGHPTPAHAFTVTGKTECPQCPDSECRAPEEAPELQMTVASMGMGLLGEMTTDALIDEISLAQRKVMRSMSHEALVRIVISHRMSATRERLMTEAGIDPDSQAGWF